MKLNKILWLGSILLVGAALVLAGCSKKENPYSPDSGYAAGIMGGNVLSTAAVTSISPAHGAMMTDLDNVASGTQGEIVIVFGADMSPGSVNLSNVVVEGYNSGGTPTDLAYVFYPQMRRLVITGSFPNAEWYRVTFKPGLVSKAGKYIDGNGNGHGDGTPYDDYIRYFYTTGVTDPTPDITHPELQSWFLTTGQYNLTDFLIILTFDAGDFDTMTVKNNISVRDSLGNPVAIASAGVAGNSMFFTGANPAPGADTMIYNMRYEVTVAVNNITDSFSFYGSENKASWSHYGYVANVPNLVWQFRRQAAPSADLDLTPIACTGGTYDAQHIRWNFNDTLDYSTVNASNAKLFETDGLGGPIIGAVNATVFYQPDDVGLYRFRMSTENLTVGSTYRIWISRNLKGEDGWYMDMNGNGIGGEAPNELLGILTDDFIAPFTYSPPGSL